MSQLRIEHRTRYSYFRPVTFGRHRLVLRPREGHDLRVADMRLEISPAHRLNWVRDVFGNSIALVDFLEPADLLEFVSTVVVERSAPYPEDSIDPWRVPYPVVYDPLESGFTTAYLAVSYPDESAVVRDWLERALPHRPADDAEGLLGRLAEVIHQTIRYQQRSEKGVQSPATTLELQSGSCRDMATLMMDATRQLGIAARFASGYLDCPASEAGRASTHAWAEAYLPLLGWRGFDPTVGRLTSLKHIVTGVSNHPRGVMPISGLFTGTSQDYKGMHVQVSIQSEATDRPER